MNKVFYFRKADHMDTENDAIRYISFLFNTREVLFENFQHRSGSLNRFCLKRTLFGEQQIHVVSQHSSASNNACSAAFSMSIRSSLTRKNTEPLTSAETHVNVLCDLFRNSPNSSFNSSLFTFAFTGTFHPYHVNG
eukprot:gb/GEZJ01004035.1/.p1 GENE.gb/GEZJ01004035.1/~~gb/GEZJ01004035.1/.p1  ORF type:complete len:136 (+),score=5.06 gb/GEZJ01004035.1/:488-895(+)